MKDRIKQLRKALNKKQSDFATDLHLATNYISLIESGKNLVSDKFIYNICQTYTNVNEDWLRTGKGNMFKPLDKEQEIAIIAKKLLLAEDDDVIANIIKNLALLDYEEYRQLNNIIKKLLKEQKDSSN